jgi:hypothetical protein
VQCPHCGGQALAGYRYCHRCRLPLRPVGAGVAAPVGFAPTRRPGAVVALGALDLLTAALLLLMTLGGAVSFFEGKDAAADLGLTAVCALLAYLFSLAGLGLLLLRPIGRRLQIGVAFLSLPFLPVGTLVGGLMLAWFLRPGARLLFSDRAAGRADPRAREAARATRALTTATALAALVPVAIVLAAFVINEQARPGRRACDEHAALAELRVVAAGFADLNDGHFAELGCLSRPTECLAEFPASAPAFVAESLARADTRHGYRFSFHPASLAESASGTPRHGLGWYALLATPVQADPGSRWLCADASGRVCAGNGRPPAVLDGRCPNRCALAR